MVLLSNGLDHWLSIAIYALVYLLVVLVNLVPDKANGARGSLYTKTSDYRVKPHW